MTETRSETDETIDVKRPPKPKVAWAWVAWSCVIALTLGLMVPILEADSNVHRWVAWLPVATACLLGGGLGWLILTVVARRRDR